MGSNVRRVGSVVLILLGMVLVAVWALGQEEQQELAQDSFAEEVMETDQADQNQDTLDGRKEDELEEIFSRERQAEENRERFFGAADSLEIDRSVSDELFQRLCEDQIFKDGEMALTGLVLDDIDGNGQMDMLVMVLDGEESPFYGSGGLWFYLNEDEAYCFDEEDCSFYGWFDVFWADVDSDENIEIIFSAQGTGCGAVGDSYKAVFKYKDHAIERMELPSDLGEDYDQGLRVELIQQPEADSYSAYCPYFDEEIFFHEENIEGWPIPYEAHVTGGNVRGYYDLCVAEYEGKKVLQASEYLSGEGGIVHCVAVAQFLITWEEDGTPKVIKWWINES